MFYKDSPYYFLGLAKKHFPEKKKNNENFRKEEELMAI